MINDDNGKTILHIYDPEIERKKVLVVEIPKMLSMYTCITQLPNGNLFCYGNWHPISGVALIIDKNHEIQLLPSGPLCCWSSTIYFKASIYCFGGSGIGGLLNQSIKFDMNANRWIKLAPMPLDDHLCQSVIFNKNILISGYRNENILIYSVEIDSFSMIAMGLITYGRKILINTERLYLIECYNRKIYENAVGDEYSWKHIADSIINNSPCQIYCTYKNGGIYIGCYSNPEISYYKFNLNEKIMMQCQYNH